MHEPRHFLFVSDVHLNHSRVPTEHILKNLRQVIFHDVAFSKLDAIFIGGDLFDQITQLPDEVVDPIELWGVELLRACAKHNVILRILEGTPSHDRGQSRIIAKLNRILNIGADCRYVETLSIERIDSLDITVLYVPDEWRLDPADTWSDVQGLLSKHQLEQVDYAVMHGCFEFQLPPHLNLPTHRSDLYLKIVKRYISIGHHHVPRFYKRIFAQGSFDRLAHGEEHPKGLVIVKDAGHPELVGDEITFVENKGAMPHVTFKVDEGWDTETLNTQLATLSRYPNGGFIAFETTRDSAHIPALKAFMSVAVEFRCKFVYSKSAKVNSDSPVVDASNRFKPMPFTRNDAEPILMTRLQDRGLSDTVMVVARELLKEAL